MSEPSLEQALRTTGAVREFTAEPVPDAVLDQPSLSVKGG